MSITQTQVIEVIETSKLITSDHIKELRRLISPESNVVAPGEDGFKEGVERWSAGAQKPAGAVFYPKSVEDISRVVAYASKHDLDIAVGGGGHSTSGASSTDGGLLISLTKMRACTCDPEAKTITAQGGCLWEDVDGASFPHGLATVGGTVHHTGVGGLTLGGGLGFLSYKYGLVVDNLLSCTMVLASGEIVTATPTSNTDLFWALSGAGQNFGVAVEFIYRAHPQTSVWAGMLLFTPDKLADLTSLWNTFIPIMSEQNVCGVMAFVRPPPAGGKPMIMVGMVCNTPDEAEARASIKPFTDLAPAINTLAAMPWPDANKFIAPPVTGYRISMKGVSFALPLREPFVRAQYDHWLAFTAPGRIAGSELTMLVWEVADRSRVAARDFAASAYANRGTHMDACIAPFWLEAADDAVCRQWARDRSEDFDRELEFTLGRRGGATGEGQPVMFYPNYDHYGIQPKNVFGSNYPRLQRLKARYDPRNLFNKLHPITPAA